MGLFEHFPYSNFHELNLGWFLTRFRQLLNDWGVFEETVNQYMEDIEAAWIEQQQKFDNINDAWEAMKLWIEDYFENLDLQQEVNNYFDEMMQQGTLAPEIASYLSVYVTPEMFGAVGDGVADDTQAWQDAVDTGKNVVATSDTYKCGTITVTEDITIDCRNAKFICTEQKLFECNGTVIATLTGESDYSANSVGYSITDAGYTSYTGMAMLKGTNNFETSRDYYMGGFVCYFKNGKMCGTYPIDVTGVSIEIVSPIKVVIENIGEIDHNYSTEDYTIEINYGYGSVVRNSNISHSGAYTVVFLYNCLNCVCDNVNIEQTFTSGDDNSYLIAFANSSYCTAKNCYLYNKNWHCITTGNTYLCYHNTVDNCYLYTSASVSYEDHENALATSILNSTCAGVGLCGLGTIDNCKIISISEGQKNCLLRLIAMSNETVAVYSVSNVEFFPADNANGSYCGIHLTSSSRVNGNTYYITKCNIRNVKNTSPTKVCQLRFATHTASTTYVKNILFANYTGDTHVDITNYVLTLLNIHDLEYSTYYPYLGSANYIFNIVHVHNCHLGTIRGTYSKIIFSDLEVAATLSGNDLHISDMLIGSGFRGKMTNGVMTNVTVVRITDMSNNTVQVMNVFSAYNSTKKYWQYYNASGTPVIEECTNF